MFITFEGLDGSGKTTQIEQLANYLEEAGYSVRCTREPGGTPIGKQIRQVVHDTKNMEMTAEAEILLYSASRAQLVREVIKPALHNGEVVLCDRYVESTYAYQGYGRQLDFESLQQLSHFATSGLKPDLIIYLDLDIRDGLARKTSAEQQLNRMDQQTVAFYDRVRQGYLEMAHSAPARWAVIPANQTIEAIRQQIQEVVMTIQSTGHHYQYKQED